MDRYQEIRKALEMGPTPGPWVVGDQNGHRGISIGSDESIVATAYLRLITSRASWGEEHFALPENQESVANATLIAACDPDTIRALLDERDALAKDAARYRCLSAMATQQADYLGPIFRIDVRRSEPYLFNFDAAVDAAIAAREGVRSE